MKKINRSNNRGDSAAQRAALKALRLALPFLIKSREAAPAYIAARYAIATLEGKQNSLIYWQP